jgi:hypothetical protein
MTRGLQGREPNDERQDLMNRLHECRVLVAGASTMDIIHLRDLVQKEEDKVAAQKLKEDTEAEVGRNLVHKMDPNQVRLAMREYLDWKRMKKGLKPVYDNDNK